VRPDDPLVDDLADAILDGAPIDWPAAESSSDGAAQPLVDQLRVLAAVAAFARGEVGDAPVLWGPLRLIERIGRGAFGQVYRAWDTRLDREVALKLLPADPSSGDRAASAIIQEGRLLARVRHQNVVTIYGAEQIDDRIGLWMEFVRGHTLEQILAERQVLSPAEAVETGLELCRAVSAVHGAGLLHRDIKTHNVMRADDGRIVLMDFGTGRELEDDASSDLAGTPLYLAPEVLQGQPATVRSDIYSLGVLLYHLVTGSYPVHARTVRKIRRAHELGERTAIQTGRRDVPSKLARVIERAIDPSPERRYESADTLGADLAVLKPRPSQRRYDTTFEAYESYLRGRYFWSQRSAAGLRKAIEHFQAAVQLDPGYADAYAGIAQSYGPLGYGGDVPPAKALAGMRAAVTRALAIDDDLADAHAARALLLAFHEWRLADAEPAFRRALALNADDATAHSWYAQYLIATGRCDEALAESRRAIELEPLSLWINTFFGRRLYWARRFDEAIAQCRKTLELDPAYIGARTCLAFAYAQRGAHEHAVRELERDFSGSAQTPSVLADLGYLYARAGRSNDAHTVITELTNRSALEYVPRYALALVYAGLGENERAFEWLERAGEERSPRLVFLGVEPAFDGLRGDPRFAAFRRKLGLP
jgi:Tfp pilus assembly protein PilF